MSSLILLKSRWDAFMCPTKHLQVVKLERQLDITYSEVWVKYVRLYLPIFDFGCLDPDIKSLTLLV